jgi:hypothetical protein
MYSLVSTLVLVILAIGWYWRHRPRRHIPLMLSAFTIDVLLVLAIEINRHAVEKVLSPSVDWFTVFHAAISLLVLLLYTAMTVLGVRIFRGNHTLRPIHGRLALVFVGFRLANYVTSFFV